MYNDVVKTSVNALLHMYYIYRRIPFTLSMRTNAVRMCIQTRIFAVYIYL